jgi:triosephosphate isomerase (TIM)
MRRLLFAANWKMQLGPDEARDFCRRFRARFTPAVDRDTWFFPSAVSLEATAKALHDFPSTKVGAQDVHWEPKGAFTGAISVPLVRAAGGTVVLVGHSERRHVFGEREEETARKLRAVLSGGLLPILCLGETLAQRERGETEAVVARQLLTAIDGLSEADRLKLVIAYEPVWAIGTGRNATPEDAAAMHRGIRRRLGNEAAGSTRMLYGGSVNAGNVANLLAQEEIEGVLVGGASLDPEGWAEICSTNAAQPVA